MERSLTPSTPCMDENRVEEVISEDILKEIEFSDISDDEQWPENIQSENVNAEQYEFKRVTKINRDKRNYRDSRSGKGLIGDKYTKRKNKSNRRKKEIERYDVRKVIASRDISISISRSRSNSPKPTTSYASRNRKSKSFSQEKRRRKDTSRSRSQSPVSRLDYTKSYRNKSLTPSPKYIKSSEYYRNCQQHKSTTSDKSKLMVFRRSSSKHKKKIPESENKKRKHHQKQNFRSNSSSQDKSPSRKIMNDANSNLTQENIKIILKNEDSYEKSRQKVRNRVKKLKKDKNKKKEKFINEQLQKKEVFASGDNILISVCFNNNISNSKHKCQLAKQDHDDKVDETVLSNSSLKKIKKHHGSRSSLDSYSQEKMHQKKYKNKKIKGKSSSKKHRNISKEPKTPPITSITKRKNDTKPIAIIDLERSPDININQSPKEIIVLSDSDGNIDDTKKSKEIIIVEDVKVLENPGFHNELINETINQHVTPESPPPQSCITQPILKFSLKSKSNILPFNLLHDKADEIEEDFISQMNTGFNSLFTIETHKGNKEQYDSIKNVSNTNLEEMNASNQIQNEAYDPFEPTKSRSISPITPPHSQDIISNSGDTQRAGQKILTDSIQTSENETDPYSSSSIWIRKDFEGKKVISHSLTPPMPPSSSIFSTNSQASKTHIIPSLYEGIYSNDLKTPVLPSPVKSNQKLTSKNILSNTNNNANEDEDRTPYSPSSDGYDYEPVQSTNAHINTKCSSFEPVKLSDIDTQSSDPSGSFSFTADDPTISKTPLKLTASTLKTFNTTMRLTGPVTVNYVNKADLSIFENYLPPMQQQNLTHAKKQTMLKPSSSFIRSRTKRISNQNDAIDESIFDDEVPNSAVDLVNKDRFLKKSLRIERVAEEVKLVLKPHYNKKHITKEEYKSILRKSVPKICHNKTGEINIQKITQLIEAYIKKFRYKRKAGISNIASSI